MLRKDYCFCAIIIIAQKVEECNMKYEIQVNNKQTYDVIVVGSGPAGVSAAISAGRNGAKTLLIESLGRIGGISTSGMMSHFTGRCGSKLYLEILDRAKAKNHYFPELEKRYIDPELLTLTYIEMLEEVGVDILLYTTFCDVVMDGNRVIGIICHNKSGFSKYDAKVVIDASGDGRYEKGKNQNILRECDVKKIVDAYIQYKTDIHYEDEPKFSHIATLDEIAENDYNLNIPRYVDTFEEEELIDIDEVKQNIANIEAELSEVQAQMKKYMEELGL
jgi:type I restriction-modification system DNA methylase subunit